MVKRSKFSIGYYLIMFLLMLFLESMFFSGSAGKEMPYSKFRDLIQKNKIQSVILESDKIYGLLKPEQAPLKAASQTQNLTSKADAEKSSSPSKPGFTPQQKQTPWYLNFEKN
jgi:cell division protease FtsH